MSTTGKFMNKLWHFYTMKFYSEIKKKSSTNTENNVDEPQKYYVELK